MAKNLRKMTIREVSLVDSPASPGAVVLFSKRRGDFDKAGPPDEPRDERGRWTGDGIKQGVKDALRATRKAVLGLARTAYRGVGSTVRTLRMTRVKPVVGGGVQFTVKGFDPIGGAHVAHFQVQPKHLKGHPGAAKGLRILQRALEIYNITPVPASDFVTAHRYVDPNNPSAGLFGTTRNGSDDDGRGAGGNGNGSGNGNGGREEPIGFSTGKKSNMTPEHSGGRAYYNRFGNLIPAGGAHMQHYHEAQARQNYRDRKAAADAAAARTDPRGRFKDMFDAPADPEPVKPAFGFQGSSGGSVKIQTPPAFNPNTIARSAAAGGGSINPTSGGSGAVAGRRFETVEQFLARGGLIDKKPAGSSTTEDDFLAQNRRDVYPEDYNKRHNLRFFF